MLFSRSGTKPAGHGAQYSPRGSEQKWNTNVCQEEKAAENNEANQTNVSN